MVNQHGAQCKWKGLLLFRVQDFLKEPVLWRLRVLWLADDDPMRTYTEVRHQLRLYAKSTSKWVIDVKLLTDCGCC